MCGYVAVDACKLYQGNGEDEDGDKNTKGHKGNGAAKTGRSKGKAGASSKKKSKPKAKKAISSAKNKKK